jgi:hypothetical protein
MLSELQRLKVAGSNPAGSHREMRRSSTAEREYVSIEIVVPVSEIESYGGRRQSDRNYTCSGFESRRSCK